MTKPFGADLWKNAQAVRFAKDGSLQAPVRVDSGNGIRVGIDAIASTPESAPARPPRRRFRTLFRRARR